MNFLYKSVIWLKQKKGVWECVGKSSRPCFLFPDMVHMPDQKKKGYGPYGHNFEYNLVFAVWWEASYIGFEVTRTVSIFLIEMKDAAKFTDLYIFVPVLVLIGE